MSGTTGRSEDDPDGSLLSAAEGRSGRPGVVRTGLGPEDLDPVDLDEVRRRVVEPVTGILAPGTVVSATVRLAPAPGSGIRWPHGPSGDEPWDVWAVLTASDGDRLDTWLCSAGFQYRRPLELALTLAEGVEDWLPETAPGWGRLVVLDLDSIRRRVLAAPSRHHDLYDIRPAEGVGSPVWHRGVNVPVGELPGDALLKEDLLGWQAEWHSLTLDETDTDDVPWEDVVARLEPSRNELVTRLRTALKDSGAVREPLRRPV